jgi:hypothetical protein
VSKELFWRLTELGLLFGLLSLILRKLFPKTAGYLPIGGSSFNEAAIILMSVTFLYGLIVFFQTP